MSRKRNESAEKDDDEFQKPKRRVTIDESAKTTRSKPKRNDDEEDLKVNNIF